MQAVAPAEPTKAEIRMPDKMKFSRYFPAYPEIFCQRAASLQNVHAGNLKILEILSI
jgi:hypothetical protein